VVLLLYETVDMFMQKVLMQQFADL